MSTTLHDPVGCGTSPAWRPFGRGAVDLEVDFDQLPRPLLVTRLLASCAPGSAEAGDYWRAQSVSQRTLGLVQLATLSCHSRTVDLLLRCHDPRCAEAGFEVRIPLADLERLQERSGRADSATARGGAVRRPTGMDQERWLELPANGDRAERIARTLWLGATEPAEDWLHEAGDALAELDPLAAFTLACACPECAVMQDHAVDLEGWALVQLRRRQQALLEEVHCLATAYRWSEPEIFALPPWRRDAYRRQIEAQQEQRGAW